MAAILRQADTLELTSQQADSIAVLNRAFTIKLDSIWTPVAKYLAALPDTYDQGEAYGRYREAREISVDALIKIVPTVRSLLTAEQMRRAADLHHPLPRRTLPRVGSFRQRRHGPRHDHAPGWRRHGDADGRRRWRRGADHHPTGTP